MVDCDVGLDPTRGDQHDVDPERLAFHVERVGDRVRSGFGRAVYTVPWEGSTVRGAISVGRTSACVQWLG